MAKAAKLVEVIETDNPDAAKHLKAAVAEIEKLKVGLVTPELSRVTREGTGRQPCASHLMHMGAKTEARCLYIHVDAWDSLCLSLHLIHAEAPLSHSGTHLLMYANQVHDGRHD